MWQMYAIGENRTNFFISLFNPRVTFYMQSPRASAILAKMFEKLDGRGGKIKFLTWPSI